MYSRAPSGGRYSPTPSTPPQSAFAPIAASVQIPFPIPKNVVLISMMEAADRQAREKESESHDDTNGSMNASDEEEEYDLNRIISGMATLSGPCGTYAVKEPEGLTLIAPDPRKDSARSDEPRLDVSASEDSIEIKEPNALEKGQTVQVVSFENGVAKLARGTGYILANSRQLVKSKSV
jgi:hypothetical protein